MRKSKFIKSTIILLIGGFVTKILGMFIKVVMARNLGTEGMGLYMMILPTFTLFMALAQAGLPTSISKLVAEDKGNNKNLIFSILPITVLFNVVILVLLLFTAPFLANFLLHESKCTYSIMSIGLVLPFISISSILRGYFFGKEQMVPHVVSNVVEDFVRLILIIIGIPIFLLKGVEYAAAFIVLSNIGSELASILVLFFFLPKHFKLEKKDFIPQKQSIKNILTISIPTTGSRLIGSIGYFFEPIILTFVLLKVGYSNSFILNEYGIINGYVMPLLLLPSFFTMAISQALIPTISYHYSRGNKKYTKKKVNQAIFFSLLIGVPITILFLLIPEVPLQLLYKQSHGVLYTKALAPICLLYYIQAPLTGVLQAMGKAKEAMQSTLGGMIIRVLLLFICSSFKIGMWGLVIATGMNIIYVTLHQAKKVKEALT
ncbi:MAG: polysaccharide biosynthesis protein [Bacilli bacterium]|nr:polysaccharide biosynthesis protein [Bacilli bacterium]